MKHLNSVSIKPAAAHANDNGCTPIDHPGPRWSDYVHKLRKAGIVIETIREVHGGPSPASTRVMFCGALFLSSKFPPKPKWIRWATYNRYEERYDRYEAILGCAALVAKLMAG